MAREVEAAKKRLSETEETSISLHHGDIQIEERLERQEFAHIIEEQLEAMTESLEAAESVAERIRRDVAAAPFRVLGGREQLTVTISIGVAATTGQGDTPESLLKRADEGVYEAKAKGRNLVIAKAA